MARVTVEDCLKYVDNRFDLVLKAAERARLIELGAVDALVPEDNDKPTVVALREIAKGIDVTKLDEEQENLEFHASVQVVEVVQKPLKSEADE